MIFSSGVVSPGALCCRWKNAVDTILKANPPSVQHVLDASLHCLPDEVLDAPPPQGAVTGQLANEKSSIAQPAPVS